jgi:triosephosphate isomerase (TIM)
MRKPLVAGNWKMFKTISEACLFVSELVPPIHAIAGVDKVLCPPFTALVATAALLEGTDIGLGAQNMHWEAQGAFTGEIAPAMVKELCEYVILGHSERRTYFGETDEKVNRKVKAALAAGLLPLVCIGETLEEYEASVTTAVITRQIEEGLSELELRTGDELIIAYEPVWAIGTGKAATPEGANAVVADAIRPVVAKMYGETVAGQVRVLYGGSVKANNAASFFSQPDIDGGLVGGACLIVDEFTKIIQAAVQ